jgi:hypothetical protein
MKKTSCLVLKQDIYELFIFILLEAFRYQIGNQNLYIEEEQTTQWPKEIVQKDKTIYKTCT